MKVIGFSQEPSLMAAFVAYGPTEPRPAIGGIAAPPAGLWGYDVKLPQGLRQRNFMVMDGQSPRGRLTAIVNPRLRDALGRPFGQLGRFACDTSTDAAQALVTAATAWLRDDPQRPATILAPMNGDTWHAYRLRTAGFDEPDFPMEPHNPDYYPGLLMAAGFRPQAAFVTKAVVDPERLTKLWEPHRRRALARGYRFRTLSRDRLGSDLALAFRLSSDIFRDRPYFAQISRAEFGDLYGSADGMVDPNLACFALDRNGDTIGLAYAVPHPRQADTANLKTFGILSRWRGIGLGPALAAEVYDRILARGFRRVNHCLMAEGNDADGLDRGLATVERRYALYSRPLD